jgi:pimeloyl-ACP methyl ester carboxylesterase
MDRNLHRWLTRVPVHRLRYPVSVPEQRIIEVEGVRTSLLTGGDGPPLVYLHGVAPCAEWLPLHERLAERFTVYAPDHPGFGKSERPEWLSEMGDLVLHYDALLRLLELKRPVLAGFSLGGWLAAAFTVTYPELPGGLVLLNAAGLHVEGHPTGDLAALQRERLTEAVFHDRIAADAYYKARIRPDDRLTMYRAMTTTALLAWNPWFDPHLRRRLARVQCPTLVLWAEHDRLIPPVYGEAYRDAIPGSELQIIPDCGHMAPVERPDEIAAAINAWCPSVEPEYLNPRMPEPPNA